MRTNPRDEREIRNDMVLVPGEYDFEVVSAKETVSKNNNEMIELQLRVFPHDAGSPRLVRDWLVSGNDLKINRFCHATGLRDAYFDDELTAVLCEGAAGTLKLTVDSSEQYGDQNRVKDYVVPEPSNGRMPDDDPEPPRGVPASQTANAKSAAPEGDEIPF